MKRIALCDKIAVESVIKTTGRNEHDCTEFLAMYKLEGPCPWRRSGEGPGSGCESDTATGEKQSAQQAMEDIMEDMCTITGCTEDQCADAFATHSLPGRSTEEIWHLVRKSLCPDGASETQESPFTQE